MDYNPQKQKEYKKIKTTLKELRVILGIFHPGFWVRLQKQRQNKEAK